MFFVVGFAFCVGLGVCRCAFVMSNAPALDFGRFACLRSALLVLLTVVRCFVVIVFPSLACVLGVLGVRFLPIIGRSGFLALCASALAGVVVLAVGIRICCLCRSLSALLRVCEAYEVLCTVDCYVAS